MNILLEAVPGTAGGDDGATPAVRALDGHFTFPLFAIDDDATTTGGGGGCGGGVGETAGGAAPAAVPAGGAPPPLRTIPLAEADLPHPFVSTWSHCFDQRNAFSSVNLDSWRAAGGRGDADDGGGLPVVKIFVHLQLGRVGTA